MEFGSFLDKLNNQILIADGAIGTLLYTYGVDSCSEELNLSQPEQIQNIHRAYIDAGADVIQTNTYAANYLKLQRYGLEDSVKEINSAAVRNAKKAAQNNAYVLGTIGGNRGVKPNSVSELRTIMEKLIDYWFVLCKRISFGEVSCERNQ